MLCRLRFVSAWNRSVFTSAQRFSAAAAEKKEVKTPQKLVLDGKELITDEYYNLTRSIHQLLEVTFYFQSFEFRSKLNLIQIAVFV